MGLKQNNTAAVLTVAVSYVCWGVLSIFWKLLGEVDALYILAQRIVWSMLFLGLYTVLAGKTEEMKGIFRSRKQVLMCLVSSVFVTFNWGIYIYSVSTDRVIEASMGYFMEPLVAAAMGLILFRERLNIYEKLTFAFSAAGIVYMVLVMGYFPAYALLIASSFAAYGAIKKNFTISAHASLFLETLWMTPLSLAFILFSDFRGSGSIGVLAGWEFILLPISGVVTFVPLLLFNMGVKKVPYYISGLLMYINPSLQFTIGLVCFHEPMDVNRLISFIIIWVGILFTVFGRIKLLIHNGMAKQ